jgi:hypothetical protein
MMAKAKSLAQEPGEVEMLLPWHAAGTLNARDARRVDEALAHDSGLRNNTRDRCAKPLISLGAYPRAPCRSCSRRRRRPAQEIVSLNISARIAGFFAKLTTDAGLVGELGAFTRVAGWRNRRGADDEAERLFGRGGVVVRQPVRRSPRGGSAAAARI